MRKFTHKVLIVLKRVNKVLTKLGSCCCLRNKKLIMRNIQLTESDCTFVHYVLRMYASQTSGLDNQDKVEIREVAAKFK